MFKTAINPGITHLVSTINKLGFVTCDSGDGETHDFPCDRAYPYVVITVKPENLITETQRLVAELKELGITVVPQGTAFAESECPVHPCIQASYDPLDGFAFIDLMGLCDKDIKKA